MRDWPPITDPELLERLAFDAERFVAYVRELLEARGPQELHAAQLERALGYPWARPSGSYVLRDEAVEPLEDVEPSERAGVVEEFAAGRHPILAFGGNGAPSWLAAKFAHFPDPGDREILVLTGYLHGVDVGVGPAPSVFGYLPAALFASPGTAVRAAVLWATPAQVTQLTWSEMSYWLGRLEDARFEMDEAGVEVEDCFAYVHRLGALCLDGEPVALSAVSARERRAAALGQQQLLAAVAERLLGDGAQAEDLVRAVFEDGAKVYERAVKTLGPSGQQLRSRWTPYPTAEADGSGAP